MANDPEGYILCAWCGEVMGWAGPETVYSLCKACLPLASQAFRERLAAPPAEDGPPTRRAAGRGT